MDMKELVAGITGKKVDLMGEIEKDNSLLEVMSVYKMFDQSNIPGMDKSVEVDKLGGRSMHKVVPMWAVWVRIGGHRNSTMRILQLGTSSCILLQLVRESSNQGL